MAPAARALLVCALFLCGARGGNLPQRARCAGQRCFTLFLDPIDFPSAKTSCEDSGGRLFVPGPDDEDLAAVTAGIGGAFWLSGADEATAARTGSGPERCASVSATVAGDRQLAGAPCGERLDGYLCQYAVEEPCGRLQASGGASVSYVTHMGFEVDDSETFPPGTVAVAEKAGGEYPDSKHLCFQAGWLRAPWNCEVLRGGCERSCQQSLAGRTPSCACPAGWDLQPNNLTCARDPCAGCAHGCRREGESPACVCAAGYRLAPDGVGCTDVDECKEGEPCGGTGEECVNTQGGHFCRCRDDFEEENGACVDVSICVKCEHMNCTKLGGVYRCVCRPGFRVSPRDPTKCEKHCAERDCPATCIPDPAAEEKHMQQCFCPEGYIQDVRDGAAFCTDIDECETQRQCDHTCENLLGGFRCLCDEGYALEQDNYTCAQAEDERGPEGSGWEPEDLTAAGAHPAAVPSYVKTGSVLGIAVFVLLCAALLCLLVQNMSKRCGNFELASLRGPDVDIFHLQQVTTDTYKRLSVDKQLRSDAQRV